MVGGCTGTADADTDLVSEIVMQENMVIIPAGLQPFTYYVGEPLEVITIESHASRGARLAVWGLRDGQLAQLAATPHIGTRHRVAQAFDVSDG